MYIGMALYVYPLAFVHWCFPPQWTANSIWCAAIMRLNENEHLVPSMCVCVCYAAQCALVVENGPATMIIVQMQLPNTAVNFLHCHCYFIIPRIIAAHFITHTHIRRSFTALMCPSTLALNIACRMKTKHRLSTIQNDDDINSSWASLLSNARRVPSI